MNPLVSVIIPNYNHANYLDERIQSVLNQTYQDFEVIILDDKSTDNSMEVINKYKDNPHKSAILVNDINSGLPFKQWRKGFELAKGELIWIAESDDSCKPTFLETLVQSYLDNNAILAFSRSCKYSVNGEKSLYENQTTLKNDLVLPGKEFITQFMIERNAVSNASSVIFSRDAAMSINNKYTEMHAEGDWLFWIELMELGTVVFLSEELNFFRFHDSNTTKSQVNKGNSAIEHKITFDYLVQQGFLKGPSIRQEKLRLLNCWIGMDFETTGTKRRLLNLWDNNRFIRLYLFAYNIKYSIKVFFSLF